MKLRCLREAAQVQVIPIDQEDDWEAAHEVVSAFHAAGINPNYNKNVTAVALINGRVVGGLMSSWERDSDQDAHLFSFDIAVDPKQRTKVVSGLRALSFIGDQLIDAGIKQYEQERKAYGDRTAISLYVINPKLARRLEQKYGFKIEAEHGGGQIHMVRY